MLAPTLTPFRNVSISVCFVMFTDCRNAVSSSASALSSILNITSIFFCDIPSENRPDRHTSRNDLSWRCFRLYRCTEKYPETGLLWNCHPKNAFVSAFLLCITWISSGFFRNPHYHGSDFCNASYVLCGNDGKCLRIRWRLCNGWNSCYNYLFCFYTSIYLLDFSFYRMI